ncbi:MAG: Tfp pilus assembly protein FimT/FimU [Solirubrobacterales bacterium]|jgi:prepilin-type N-terminal cleavage/methylation domain-containing protein
MNERGFTLIEISIVVFLILVLVAMMAPSLKAYSVEAHLLGAGQIFKGEFLKARSMAVKQGVYTAIRFERDGDRAYFSTYADGNHNGVRTADINSGIDQRVSGPHPLHGGAPDVRVGINPAVREIPPDTGWLSGDPIRFGSSDILSFSPLGTATPGTFYLAGDGVQAAVRVSGSSARVRLWTNRGTTWVTR